MILKNSFILTFHNIHDSTNPFTFSGNKNLSISKEYFENVIITLKRRKFNCVDLSKILNPIEKRNKLVSFTFDDGYSSVIKYALPIIEKYEVPITIFINKSFSQGKKIPWWILLDLNFSSNLEIHKKSFEIIRNRILESTTLLEQRKILEELNLVTNLIPDFFIGPNEIKKYNNHPLIRFENHGANHLSCTNLDLSDFVSEISECKEYLEEITLKKSNFYCFPYGQIPKNKKSFKILESHDIDFALTTKSGFLTEKSIKKNPYKIPRMNVTEGSTLIQILGRKNLIKNGFNSFKI